MYFIGTSAGAMVCSKTLKSAMRYGNVFADVAYELGFTDYEIWPHYEDKQKLLMAKYCKDVKVKLLKDGEYIIEGIMENRR